MSVHLFNIGILIFYLAGALLQWIKIIKYSVPKTLILSLIGMGVCLHAYTLGITSLTSKGLCLNVFSIASLISLVVLLIVLFGSIRHQMCNIFAVFLPIVCINTSLAWIFYSADDGIINLKTSIILHVVVSIIAYSVLSIASIQSCFLAFQAHKIKHHTPNMVLKLFPSLETMERLLINYIIVGTFFLSISLVTGFMYLGDLLRYHLSHHIFLFLSIGSWSLFATIIFGNYYYGWRGIKIILLTIFGYTLLLLAYFGIQGIGYDFRF